MSWDIAWGVAGISPGMYGMDYLALLQTLDNLGHFGTMQRRDLHSAIWPASSSRARRANTGLQLIRVHTYQVTRSKPYGSNNQRACHASRTYLASLGPEGLIFHGVAQVVEEGTGSSMCGSTSKTLHQHSSPPLSKGFIQQRMQLHGSRPSRKETYQVQTFSTRAVRASKPRTLLNL